ncbi:MAG: AbrB/MazE/SpoVT family DNA-binding domain-containing protein [Anaerolineae bacterium]|nr:AbrB/MazE/SpoVT family DNA-binding domain-containing protein [Anaerolineae bacterium]
MKTRVQKWGNSLALRIPKAFADEIGIVEESEVEMRLVEGQLVIAPPRHKVTLEELVAQITDENRPGETDWGPPVGNEVW